MFVSYLCRVILLKPTRQPTNHQTPRKQKEETLQKKKKQQKVKQTQQHHYQDLN